MFQYITLLAKCSRVILWPAIFLNAGSIAFALSGSVSSAISIAAALAFAASFGFIINDCADIAVDKINRANRLENATVLERQMVERMGWAFLVLALIIAATLGVRGVVGIVLIAAGLMVYTQYARRRLFFATALASVLSSSPLWFPNVVLHIQFTSPQLVLLGTAAIFLMGREIVFDVHDVKGDDCGGRRTFATVFGNEFALTTGAVLNLTGAASLLLLLIFAGRAANSWAILVGSIGVLIGLILPVAFKLRGLGADGYAFDAFVSRSRVAMLLVPVIWWFL